MTPDRIRELLNPFLSGLSEFQLRQILVHFELLNKWNSKINLTAIRDPEEVVKRHFGESFFAAQRLFPDPNVKATLTDLGSGAGFPGLPMKIFASSIQLTLIESNQKKAAFLREAIRSLGFADAGVVAERAEGLQIQTEFVTLRAVERFEKVLPVLARLVGPGGQLLLLIGSKQAAIARSALPGVRWGQAIPIPLTQNRVVLMGRKMPV